MFCPRGNQINVKLPGINLDAGTQSSHRATEKECPQPNDNVEFADDASASPDSLEVEDRQHPTLWFPDGSLTVIASDGVKFKLHPGLLAHHSEILKECMAIATSSSLGTSQARGLLASHQELKLNLPENGDDLSGLFGMIYNGGTQ